MKIKEFTKREDRFFDWLSWRALIDTNVLLNKDGGLMGCFVYEHLIATTDRETLESTLDKAIDNLCDILLGFGSGWVLYNNKIGNKCFLTIYWLPKQDEAVFYNVPESKIFEEFFWKQTFSLDHALTIFKDVLHCIQSNLANICDVQAVGGQAYIDFLRERIAFNADKIDLPNIPIYLDALLSMDISISGTDEKLIINGNHVEIVTPMGYTGDQTHKLIENLDLQGIDYEFATRFVFFDLNDADKEINRYVKKWCNGRRSMLKMLDYSETETSKYGYYTTSIILHSMDAKTLLAQTEIIETALRDMGIAAISEDGNIKDTWYGTIPGMIRANLRPPLVLVQDVSELLIF